LTGRAVEDPAMLQFPAVLVSISNMPVTARPQAGPGFAPWVYELYIGEGTTRFLNVFYGDFPRAIPNVSGGCKVRDEIIHPRGDWIGDRVWLDENANGQQDAWEAGVGGVCVRLLNGTSREVLAETTTDSNGYYAFDRPDAQAILQFVKPDAYEFTQPNLGNDDQESLSSGCYRIALRLGRGLDPVRGAARHPQPRCDRHAAELVYPSRALRGTHPFGAVNL
jgi:hypothetical protein